MIFDKAKNELDKLLQGNKNFVNGTPTAKNMSLETLKKFAYHQEPYACVLTCSIQGLCRKLFLTAG